MEKAVEWVKKPTKEIKWSVIQGEIQTIYILYLRQSELCLIAVEIHTYTEVSTF